jgi:F1F0 ATPase subunit 2
MSNIAGVGAGILLGALLSGFYFFGLWYTVKKIKAVNKPYFLAGVSFIGRMALVLGSLVLIGKYFGPIPLLSAAGMLVITRFVIMAIIRRTGRVTA